MFLNKSLLLVLVLLRLQVDKYIIYGKLVFTCFTTCMSSYWSVVILSWNTNSILSIII